MTGREGLELWEDTTDMMHSKDVVREALDCLHFFLDARTQLEKLVVSDLPFAFHVLYT